MFGVRPENDYGFGFVFVYFWKTDFGVGSISFLLKESYYIGSDEWFSLTPP
jgi:hypothetical protein